jgi:hypothetical protein
MPADATSLEELERIVEQLSRRENRWQVFRRIAEASNVALAPDEIWLLARICLSAAPIDPAELTWESGISNAKLGDVARRLEDNGLVARGEGGTLLASGPKVAKHFIPW